MVTARIGSSSRETAWTFKLSSNSLPSGAVLPARAGSIRASGSVSRSSPTRPVPGANIDLWRGPKGARLKGDGRPGQLSAMNIVFDLGGVVVRWEPDAIV